MVCTGKEERLLDCDFPQNFGIDYEYERPEYEYANWPGSTHPAPEPAPLESAPAPAGGLPNGGCSRSDRNRLAVICRRFEITGTAKSHLLSSWNMLILAISPICCHGGAIVQPSSFLNRICSAMFSVHCLWR